SGSVAFALLFAGARPPAAASCVCAEDAEKKFVTRSLAALSTPCADANFVTMRPLTPRNGTEALAIAGTWITFTLIPAFAMSPSAHGPVIQYGVWPFVKAVSHVA